MLLLHALQRQAWLVRYPFINPLFYSCMAYKLPFDLFAVHTCVNLFLLGVK
nr:MAG TPA: hypothetical protein [Bacteriophage sp.]